MTSFRIKTITCAVCGASVECTILMSTNAFGSPDLDLRPPEMQRSTLGSWLQECTECGYVAGDISIATDGAREIIASSEYRKLLADDQLPEIADIFHRFSLLQTSDSRECGIAKLRAAWACDDAGAGSLAQQYRSDAADRLLELRPFEDSEDGASLGTMLVDVLRRASRHGEALDLIHELNTMTVVSSNETVGRVLVFQQALCREEDIGCHTIADARNAG